ncbi:MAG: S1 RNA-binding domain-containing protein [Candidatus Nanosalina sp.]
MRWYKKNPEEGDFVVVTLTDVDKNSAYAKLEEYEDVEGLIHISEVSRSWVQDIRKELDEGEKKVAQVIDTEGDKPTLSLKRVNEKNKRDTMQRWKKEQKAEKFIEKLADRLGKDKEEIYEEVAFPMQEEFGSSFHGFEISVAEEDRLLELFDEETVEAIQEVAEENINLKQEKLEGTLQLFFPQGDGLERIKDVLKDVQEGVEIKYISAPEYSIKAWGPTQEVAKDRIDDAIRNVRDKVEDIDGNFDFSRA